MFKSSDLTLRGNKRNLAAGSTRNGKRNCVYLASYDRTARDITVRRVFFFNLNGPSHFLFVFLPRSRFAIFLWNFFCLFFFCWRLSRVMGILFRCRCFITAFLFRDQDLQSFFELFFARISFPFFLLCRMRIARSVHFVPMLLFRYSETWRNYSHVLKAYTCTLKVRVQNIRNEVLGDPLELLKENVFGN